MDLLSLSWLGGAFILNMMICSIMRRKTFYLLGLFCWLLAIGLSESMAPATWVIERALTGYPLVFVVGSVGRQIWDSVLR